MSSLIPLWCLLVFVGVVLSSAQAQIVGGTPSAPGKWPYIAGLFFRYAEMDSPHCGAVVWDKDTLLTAAHCVSSGDFVDPKHPELFYVYMGHNSWTQPRDIQYMFNVKEIRIHPNFHKDTPFYYDIAFIFLDRSIDFNGINRKVQCVNGPEPFDYLDTSSCVALGWGYYDNSDKQSKNLMEVILPILDNHICEKQSEFFDPHQHLCAGDVRQTFFPIGVNSGDSGGPFVCPQITNPDKYSLVGIANYGMEPLKCKPSYFTKVELFQFWMTSVHHRTCNGEKLAKIPYWWANYKKRWFEQLFSYNDLLHK